MQFRSSVESTRPLTGTSQITKWKHFWMRASFALLALVMSAVSAGAWAQTITVISGNNQSGEIGTVLPDPLTVRYLNGAGAPIAGGSLIYTITSGDAVLVSTGGTSAFVTTDGMGNAAQQVRFGSAPGPVTVQVTDFASTPPANFNLTATSGAVVPPTVTYNPAPGSTITLSPSGSVAFGSIDATPSGGSGTGPAATTTINNCSFATNPVSFAVTGQPLAFQGSTTQPGTLSLTCQVGPSAATARLNCSEMRGTAKPVARFFNVICPAAPPPPTITLVNGDGQSGPPNTQLPQPVVAEYRDGNGIPVAKRLLMFSITSANAMVRRVGDTTFSTNAFGTTGAVGQASFEVLLGPSAGPVTGTVCEPPRGPNAIKGFAQCATFTATIVAPPPPTITLAGGDGQSGPPNTVAPNPLAAVYRDGAGNPVVGRRLIVEITSGNAQVRGRPAGTPGTSVAIFTDGSGQILADILFGPTPGAVTGRVIESPPRSQAGTNGLFGLAAPAPFTATIVAGAPTLTITNGNNQTGQPGTTLPVQLTVRLLDSAGSPINGASVLYTVSSGTASFAGQSSLTTSTDTAGNAFATLGLGATPGPVTVTATSMGQTVTFNETIAVANIAPMVTFNPPAGSGLTLSASGTTASGSITATPSGGSGSGPSATTTVDNCTFATNPVSFTVAGQPLSFMGPDSTPQSLSLTCQVGPNAATARLTCSERRGVAKPVARFFDVTCPAAPVPPTITIVSGEGQSGPPNTQLPQPVVAELRDGSGIPVASRVVRFSITSANAMVRRVGDPTFSASAFGTTDAAGRTSFEVLLGSSAGPVTGTVCEPAPRGPDAIDGFAPCAPFTATISTPAGGSIQIVSGNNQAGDPGTNSQPLGIQLVGSGIAGVPVTFTLVSGSGALLDANGNPAAQVVVSSDPGGTASVVFRYGSTPGPVRIRAAAQGFGSVVFDLTVVDPTAGDSLRIVSGDGQSGASGTRSAPLIVELRRRSAPSPGETISWFVRSGDAQLDNSSTTTSSDGRSTNFITFGQTQGPIVIEARSSDGRLVVQFTLNTVAPAAPNIRLASGGGQSGPINSAFAAPLVFEVTNSQGQPQSGMLVSFAVTQGSATLDANTATTDAQGRASVSGRYGPNAGPIQVRASIGSGPTLRSAIADLTAFAPGLRIVSGDNQSALVGTTLPAPLVVELTRPAGSTGSIAGIVLRWAVIEGGGRVTNATTTTDAAGRASNAFALGPNAGANRVRVDADGGGTVTFVATATAAPPPAPTARVEIVSGNNQDLATNTNSAPLVVRAFNGATLVSFPNVCVAFSSSTPGVTLSHAQVNSDANGRAQTIARLADVGPAIVSARICNATSDQVNFALNGAIGNTLGLDPDDRAFPIAQAFDNACAALRTLRSGGATLNAGQADLLARCDDLEFNAGNNPDGVVDALEEILSDEAEAQNTAALTIAAAQFDNLKARIAALRSGTNGAGFGGLALQGSNGAVPLSFASSALNGSANASATDGQPAPAEAGIDFDRWGFFATGTIGDGDRDPGGGSTGFDFETRGLTAGVDYRYNDSLIFGVALGYASNDTDIGSGAGELESTGLSISGYSTFYKGDAWYADGVLTYGSNQYDIKRNLQFTLTNPSGIPSTVNQVNTASPDGTQFSAAFTAGRDFQRGAWGFGPFLRWQYTSVDFDGYAETVSNPNAPGLGLTVAVNQRKVKSMQGVLGGKATYTMSTAWGILIPHFQFEYLREFKSDPDALLSQLVFDPTGTQIEVTGSVVDQSFMNLGLGVSAIFANGRSAFMYYEKLLGQEGTSKDSLAIGIRIEF